MLPIRIVKPLRDKTVLARHKATLECTVSHARGRVRWLRGDTEIFAGDKYEICNLDCYRTLIIHRVGPEDEDSYTCDAFDDRSTARLLVEGEHAEGCSGTGAHVLLSHPLLLWGSDPWAGVCAPPRPPLPSTLCPCRELGAEVYTECTDLGSPSPPGAAPTSPRPFRKALYSVAVASAAFGTFTKEAEKGDGGGAALQRRRGRNMQFLGWQPGTGQHPGAPHSGPPTSRLRGGPPGSLRNKLIQITAREVYTRREPLSAVVL